VAPQAPLDDLLGGFGGIFGLGASSLSPNDLLAVAVDPFNQISNGFLDIAGAIPIFNIVIGNWADGNALYPDGYDAGIFAGDGGNGLNCSYNALTETSTNGGNGGNGGNGVNGFFPKWSAGQDSARKQVADLCK
jgi:hypothetical protein